MSHLSERHPIPLVSPPLHLLVPLLFLDMAYPGLRLSRDTMWHGATLLESVWPTIGQTSWMQNGRRWDQELSPHFVPLKCLWKGGWGSCQPKAEVNCVRVMVDLGIWNQSIELESSGDCVGRTALKRSRKHPRSMTAAVLNSWSPSKH